MFYYIHMVNHVITMFYYIQLYTGAYAVLKKWGVWGRSGWENFSRPRPLDSRERGQRPF